VLSGADESAPKANQNKMKRKTKNKSKRSSKVFRAKKNY
jgi:hypothetical protein